MTNQEAIETIEANYPPENYSMLREALNIALALMKEQKPTEPIAIKQERVDEFYGAVSCCPKCDCVWIMCGDDMHFCPKCGQAVKWES